MVNETSGTCRTVEQYKVLGILLESPKLGKRVFDDRSCRHWQNKYDWHTIG